MSRGARTSSTAECATSLAAASPIAAWFAAGSRQAATPTEGKAAKPQQQGRTVNLDFKFLSVSAVREEVLLFDAEGQIEAHWELTADDWSRWSKNHPDRGKDSMGLDVEYPDPEQLAFILDDEIKAVGAYTHHLWSPRIHLRNLEKERKPLESWHTVKRSHSNSWDVRLRVKFVGCFPLPITKVEDESNWEKALPLAIVISTQRDCSQLQFQTGPAKIEEPERLPQRSHYFLEPADACARDPEEEEGQFEMAKWESHHLISVGCGRTKKSFSATEKQYPVVVLHTQAVHESDETHYRMPKGRRNREITNMPRRLSAMPSPQELLRVEEEAEEEKRREINVRCSVVRLVNIDLVQHTFQADIFIEAEWLDHSVRLQRFADPKTGLEMQQPDSNATRSADLLERFLKRSGYPRITEGNAAVERLGLPRLRLRNCIKEERAESWVRVEYVRRNGQVNGSSAKIIWRMICLGNFVERFELHNFPLDTQVLSIELVDFSRAVVLKDGTTSTLRIQDVTKNSVNDMDVEFPLSSEYDLSSHVFSQETQTPEQLSGSKVRYSLIRFRLRVRRKHTYYIYKLCLPICVITLSSFSTFTMQADESISNRLEITLACVATLATYSFIILQTVPKVSYLTRLDVYFTVSFVTLFVVAMQNAFIGFMSEKAKERAAKDTSVDPDEWFTTHERIQSIFWYASVIAWVAWNAFCGSWCLTNYELAKAYVNDHPEKGDQSDNDRGETEEDWNQTEEPIKVPESSIPLTLMMRDGVIKRDETKGILSRRDDSRVAGGRNRHKRCILGANLLSLFRVSWLFEHGRSAQASGKESYVRVA